MHNKVEIMYRQARPELYMRQIHQIVMTISLK